jgi:hypothetical protein
MIKSFRLYFFGVVFAMLGLIISSCNSDSTWGTDPDEVTGTAVTAFSLQANSDVLNNLDTIYFSIDLVNCKIYNASPLPYGTEIDSLAVSISAEACSVAELYYTSSADGESKTLDYLTSPDEKIDFSCGAVTLHLVSANGEMQRDYEIRVNVASAVSDSLYWDKLNSGSLYGVPSMKRTKTVKVGDRAKMMSVSDAGNLAISTFVPATQSGGGNWESALVYPTFTNESSPLNVASIINVDTFTATDEGVLYVADNNGYLYQSADEGATFSYVDDCWESIVATYGSKILGVKNNAGSRTFAEYPGGSSVAGEAIPASFPVSGTSGAVKYSTIWSTKSQVVMAGGRLADGSYTGAVWGYDGDKWAKISETLPAGAGYVLASYTIAETDTVTWSTTERDVLIAFGGLSYETADAMTIAPACVVYVSKDMGLNWATGADMLQLPDYIPFTTRGSMLVFDKTFDVNTASPMAVTPITSWDCPYLYLFGGYDIYGNLQDTYWSGVVNYLTRKPLQ